MKYFHETLLLYCLNVIAHVSYQYKNCVHREKVSSDSENLIALILIFFAENKNKKIKKTEMYLNETTTETQERQKSMC